jgi:hypothetical protein
MVQCVSEEDIHFFLPIETVAPHGDTVHRGPSGGRAPVVSPVPPVVLVAVAHRALEQFTLGQLRRVS